MTRKAFLALLLAIPSAAVATFKRKVEPTAGLCWFRSKFMAVPNPDSRHGFVFVWKRDVSASPAAAGG